MKGRALGSKMLAELSQMVTQSGPVVTPVHSSIERIHGSNSGISDNGIPRFQSVGKGDAGLCSNPCVHSGVQSLWGGFGSRSFHARQLMTWAEVPA